MANPRVSQLIKLVLKFYRPLRVRDDPWRPGVNVSKRLAKLLRGLAETGDILVLSEKSLAVARGRVFDESSIKPSPLSKALTLLLMRIAWGYLLGPICKLKPHTLNWIRAYPTTQGARHKQLAARLGGPLEVLKPSSEAGIDASNLPLSLVALPLDDPGRVAEEIRNRLIDELGVDLTVIVVDSDRLYHHRSLNLALLSRRIRLSGGVYLGFASFMLGRLLRRWFMPLATPMAVAGRRLDKWLLLGLVELADRLRGVGAGRTAFDVAQRLGVPIEGVTWGMLKQVRHYPAVLLKLRRASVEASPLSRPGRRL